MVEGEADGEADVASGGLAAASQLEVRVASLSGDLLSTQQLPLDSTMGDLRSALVKDGMISASAASFLLHGSVSQDSARLVEASMSLSGICDVQIIKKPALPAPFSGGVVESMADLADTNIELRKTLVNTRGELYDDEDLEFALVLDCGSFEVKAGFSGHDSPHSILPTVAGRPLVPGSPDESTYIGDEAMCMRGILKMEWPVQYGLPVDFKSMEQIWHHTFYNELRVPPECHPILLLECLLNPRANREKTVEIMFEHFKAPALFVVLGAVMTLYSVLKTTGLAVDCGRDCCSIVPISDGFAHAHAASQLGIGGKALDDYLCELLKKSDLVDLRTTAERDIARDMKERLCFVARDFQAEEALQNQRDYEIPDGRVIQVGHDRFHCPEALFNPRLLDNETPGLHQLVFQCAMACDASVRFDLFNNIMLSGGSSMFPGMAERMTKELRALAPAEMNVMVVDNPDRKHSAWVGGSMLASGGDFQKLWITLEDYNDVGLSILQMRCP